MRAGALRVQHVRNRFSSRPERVEQVDNEHTRAAGTFHNRSASERWWNASMRSSNSNIRTDRAHLSLEQEGRGQMSHSASRGSWWCELRLGSRWSALPSHLLPLSPSSLVRCRTARVVVHSDRSSHPITRDSHRARMAMVRKVCR